MRLKSRRIRGALRMAALILLAIACGAKMPAQTLTNAHPQPESATTAAAQPAEQSATAAQSPGKSDTGLYLFKTEVREVVLHATVMDKHHRPVFNLSRDAFHVFDDGQPQRITSFHQDDVPVAMAIVIDNSGSMRDKRPAVNAAALNLVRASNPQDQVCVVNFNSDFYLDQDYTSNIGLLRAALQHIESRGGTAFYDALVATSDHLMRSAKLQRRVILVVTDGEDDASHDTLEQAVRAIAVDGGPAVYSIGLLGHEKAKKARRALRVLSEQTGGVSYFPTDLSQVDAISQEIARDIRTQYTIGYRPFASGASTPLSGFHRVLVTAKARGYKRLSVRTRTGYYVNAGQSSTASR
jgi:Ca-activated chloride channel homolog